MVLMPFGWFQNCFISEDIKFSKLFWITLSFFGKEVFLTQKYNQCVKSKEIYIFKFREIKLHKLQRTNFCFKCVISSKFAVIYVRTLCQINFGPTFLLLQDVFKLVNFKFHLTFNLSVLMQHSFEFYPSHFFHCFKKSEKYIRVLWTGSLGRKSGKNIVVNLVTRNNAVFFQIIHSMQQCDINLPSKIKFMSRHVIHGFGFCFPLQNQKYFL